ncbi:uncharacterized protein CcaverHIS019_0111160 [Cutaneotrichosporon cavernicola]|uniref:Phospholipid-transporting ATPase n=1 Tax=Cutaneotrichosporon cavernicola TaxID=279322 RepID=A0AA48II59_9TREE|nr:uncharacterized protein CcaverHIS019_0111160 [Cutaneotrichosporon cavernicola]BEI88398.1 hypothetical protein CcaverHIS019_0111160 [Cutaneotrichosporon cavernicola]BEI96171.1 hypothetical protein CcaverHIS631_0111200 [Cutaneotrichosporon cavernicola]BEJ03943.1 hypothetical protein CcaverHIS641_0111180 [Cutaneotrichosporon cavernicola]
MAYPRDERYGYGDPYAGPSNYMSHPLDDQALPSSSTAVLNPQQQRYYDAFNADEYDPNAIDPALRLRTTRTAHSVIAESIRSEDARMHRKRSRLLRHLTRKRIRRRREEQEDKPEMAGKEELRPPTIAGSEAGGSQADTSVAGDEPEPSRPHDVPKDKTKVKKGKKQLPRREVYVNMPLPPNAVDKAGEPLVRYARNKVRTSKYTLLTFLPRNLFEQFHRVANMYFLGLVILQLFPIFGATTPEIAMLPLVAILGMTAIKDGVEDWRRASLDEQVNTSAATKLGNWRNENQPTDPRNWFERLFHIGQNPQKPSKGVRKLREAEARAGKQIVMERVSKEHDTEEIQLDDTPRGTLQLPASQQYPSSDSIPGMRLPYRPRAISVSSSTPSATSGRSAGAVDYSMQTAGTAQWERTLWKKLEVGDLVLLRDNEQIPADVIVLATSDADGLCFVETKNLDGETNLKPRKAVKATSHARSEEDLEHSRFMLDSEPPHANLYSYNGLMRYRSTSHGRLSAGEEKVEPVTINEMLLRGCTIRNTKWVIGLVVFTGADTKIMLNGGDTPSKRSKIERETNFNVIMNFIILMVLCLLTALLHGVYRYKDDTSAKYYEIGAAVSENVVIDSVVIFVSSLVVFQNIVPISLYITIEIVKTIQAFFIFQDIEMYYAPYDTPCVPKRWNISDDLGQIEYVFSDKTGTLTQNVMEFKKCSIQGVSFGEGFTEAMLGAAKREGKDLGMTMEDQAEELEEYKETMINTMKRAYKNRYLREDQLTLVAPNLAQRLADKQDPLRPDIIAFFRALALCHTVLSDKAEPEDKPFCLDYKAESPDEAALVSAARDAGFPFVTRNTQKIDIEVLGIPERWTPLRVLEFNSTRKRMSVIVRSPEGQIVLYCKGADTVIYERLVKNHNEQLKQTTLKDLETFANAGLRTLCIAYRYMGEQEFDQWSKQYDEACAAVNDREDKIDKACEVIEHSLTILGATALEDKLQEGVPDAIAMLHKAGIKLWILTGDKLQTAIEIGYSCNLLTNDMEVMIISADSPEGARAQIESGLNKIASTLGPPPTRGGGKIYTAGMNPSAEFAVVIDGESLRYALDPSLKTLFLSLGTQCAAVICCRVSPAQKAQTVKLVKDGCNAMTLSIGDGANDVAMIQEANIGVGLFGLEGSQAAMSADYAFGQFRFLTRLLLVHGRWSYVRVADMHANFFYKNVIWTLAMFWFLIFCSFDATYLFEYTFVLLYNLIFTSLPVGILGAFDQDTNAVCSMAYPQLYTRGIMGLDYTRVRFWLYMLDGLYQSAIIFFIPYFIYGDGTTWSSSARDTNNLYDLSSAIAAAGIFAANLYVGINTRYWTFIPWIIIPLSTLAVFIWIAVYSYMSNLAYYGVVSIIFPTFTFWATVVFTVMLAVGPHWLLRAFKQSYFPIDKDIIREAWVGGDLKDQLGVPHRKRRRRLHPDIEGASYAYKPRPAPVETRFESPIRPSDPLLHQHAPNSDSVGPSTPTSPSPHPDPAWPAQAWPQPKPDQPYTQSWNTEAWRDTPGSSGPSPDRHPPAEHSLVENLAPLSSQRRQPPSAWANPDFTEGTEWQNRPPSEFDENYAGRAV